MRGRKTHTHTIIYAFERKLNLFKIRKVKKEKKLSERPFSLYIYIKHTHTHTEPVNICNCSLAGFVFSLFIKYIVSPAMDVVFFFS